MARPKAGPSLSALLIKPLLDLSEALRDENIPESIRLAQAVQFTKMAIAEAAKRDNSVIPILINHMQRQPEILVDTLPPAVAEVAPQDVAEVAPQDVAVTPAVVASKPTTPAKNKPTTPTKNGK